MARIKSDPKNFRLPALKRQALVYPKRGQLILAKWPRSRGTPKSSITRQQNNWIQWTAKALAYAAPSQMAVAREATDNKLKYARDLLTQAAAGKMYTIEDENGETLTRNIPQVHRKVFTGARLELSSNLNLVGGSLEVVTWPTPIIDTSNFYSVLQPTRLTIPEGIEYVTLKASGLLANAASIRWAIFILDSAGVAIAQQDTQSDGTRGNSCDTGPIQVAEGDWFECYHLVTAARTLNGNPRTFFTVQVEGTDFA